MEKIRKILDTALRLFVECGFHGTPTSKIALEAGVANGTLFNKFATKDELILALYIDIKTRMMEYVAQNTMSGNSLKENMKGAYLASMYWALDNKNEFRFVEQFKTSPYYSLIVPGEIEESVKPFCDLLQNGICDKIIKPLPVDYLFSLISSHTYGLNQYLLKNDFPKAKQHAIISDTFELLWDMIT
jgi:AcrR family transcriptional regulator